MGSGCFFTGLTGGAGGAFTSIFGFKAGAAALTGAGATFTEGVTGFETGFGAILAGAVTDLTTGLGATLTTFT